MTAIYGLIMEFWRYLEGNWTFAGVAAVCAGIVTLCEIHATRKHNRLSVKPFLTDHTYTVYTNNGATESFELTNNGLGPALIKKFEVIMDGVPLQYKDEDGLQEQIQKFLPAGKITHIKIFTNLSAIPANEKNLILQIAVPSSDVSKCKKLQDLAPKISLRIEYESMYGEKQVYCSRTNSK